MCVPDVVFILSITSFNSSLKFSLFCKIHYSDLLLRNGSIDAFAEAQAALIDILLLSEGDFFVGKFTSNIDRIVYSLMSATKHGIVPYASLDSPWCFDFGQRSGRGDEWPFLC